MKTPKTLPFMGATVESHNEHKKLDYKKLGAVSMLKDGESYITGYEFLKRLKESGKTLLNGDDLDYLLKHQELIPENLKGKYLYAFGSIFRGSGGFLFVRCAVVGVERWVSRYDWLGSGFDGLSLALSLANTKTLKSSDSLDVRTLETLSERVEKLEAWAKSFNSPYGNLL